VTRDTAIDALLPPQIADRAEEIGVSKVTRDATTTFALAVLAGAFIALGAIFATTVGAGAAGVLPFGVGRLIAGLAFSLGLILVIVGGAELFTGNALIVMAWASGRVTLPRLLANWGVVFIGNLVGSLATTVIMYVAQQHTLGDGAVGANALAIARAKVQLGFAQAVALGVLCNALVCLAVWLSLSARSTTDRILAIVFPIAAFVAAGFEHSVANMYFIPIALIIKNFARPEFWTAIAQTPEEYAALTWSAFLIRNLVPVTLGNVIGGAGLVGAVYWFIYLRRRRQHPAATVGRPQAVGPTARRTSRPPPRV
jgi:formate transporter